MYKNTLNINLAILANMLLLGFAFSPIVKFLESYVFDDWQFIISMATIVVMDTLLGFAVALKFHKISSKGFGTLFQKIIVYCVVLVSTHAVAHFKIHGEVNTILTWLDAIVYSAIMVRELISVLENAGKLGNFIPVWILNKLKIFDETGHFDETAKETNSTQNKI